MDIKRVELALTASSTSWGLRIAFPVKQAVRSPTLYGYTIHPTTHLDGTGHKACRQDTIKARRIIIPYMGRRLLLRF